MHNPTRRNRNIGTAKQGHGKDNSMVVPYPAVEMKVFYERMGPYKKVTHTLNRHTFTFVVEKTRDNSFHACTIDDIIFILEQIPPSHYGDLSLIVLRQPTRKEETLRPVWGRFIYSYEFEKGFYPAVILEAVDLDRQFKWGKKLSVEDQQELQRLKDDGHPITLGKRHYEADYTLENIRNTQLYRTLPHEFGHYVHYLEVVEWLGEEDEPYEAWEKRDDAYFRLPRSEKEVFAHAYADKLKQYMTKQGIIPFERRIDEARIAELGLDVEDFCP